MARDQVFTLLLAAIVALTLLLQPWLRSKFAQPVQPIAVTCSYQFPAVTIGD